ncbi:MAG TPA: N-6 DNA methylase [Archangium sp.]|uniref:HsdM family class I SAM-dependent methyltransferase n=1 Tax=Archangium sp. TaxID=1872627 RepID=UPI002E309CA3|nr:N-6 DNA methylase [Archangium sp.]HEX5748670.1 N-6 DNA methylase [Archangium sp.]
MKNRDRYPHPDPLPRGEGISAGPRDSVARLWSLCDVLRDDGTSFHHYVTELTQLLFLKMAKEAGQEDALPKGQRWDDLKARSGAARYDFYQQLLLELGRAPHRRVSAIYASARTALRQPRHLEQLVDGIDALDWFSAREDGLGNLYEGLLEKNATDIKSGAGQYFTPRALINTLVALVQPQPGERIQDPAAGTGGFLVAAHEHIKARTRNLQDLGEKEATWQVEQAYTGVELVPETQRLALMNCLLHGIEGPRGGEGAIQLGDSLSGLGASLPRAHVILTNPPFGTKKGGGRPTREDLTYSTSNKQLVFLQHIYRGLAPGGRAAVVLPDNVLFEDGVGQKVRTELMDLCELHTLLRLPTGLFYAQGVKTNVLFFTRGQKDTGNTKAVWVYDLRANMPNFGKRTPFTSDTLKPFVHAYGTDPHGRSPRTDEGETGRFRKFTREELARRHDNLDIAWLKDDSQHAPEDLPDPELLSAEIEAELQSALRDIQALTKLLTGAPAEDDEEAA